MITLAILALAYTAYLAQHTLLILLITVLVSLLLSPGVKLFYRIKVPRPISALILICLIVFPALAFVGQLQAPVTKWAILLPELTTHVSQQINELGDAIESSTKPTEPIQQESSWTSWFEGEPKQVQERKDSDVIATRVKESLFSIASDIAVFAPMLLVQLFTTVILIWFTLIYSPRLFEQYVKLFVPQERRSKGKQFALLTQHHLSRYILTISAINFLLGLAAILFLYSMQLEDALLLGAIVGLLNFIPYLGPSLALCLLAIGALVQWGMDINVLLVLGGILFLNIVESQLLTPLVLARSMRINPLIIILWLLLSAWMWGLVGVIIAVPLFVCFKLMLDQMPNSKKWVEFLST